MGPLDALWHLLNFVAPAVGVGLLAGVMAKLLWRRSLRNVPYWPLAGWAAAAGLAALVLGLVVFGHDSRMATYGLLVVSTAGALWWKGLRRA